MSALPDVEAILRALRKRIIQLMLQLPRYMMENAFPESVGLGEILGKSMFNAPTLSGRVYLADYDGNALAKHSISTWSATAYEEIKIVESLADYIDKQRSMVYPYKAVINGTEYKRVARLDRIGAIDFGPVDSRELISFVYPANYPPKEPPEFRATGVMLYDCFGDQQQPDYELFIVIGNVGYKRADTDNYVFWNGIAILLLLYTDKYVEIRSAHGRFGYTSDMHVMGMVVSSVFSAVMREIWQSWP